MRFEMSKLDTKVTELIKAQRRSVLTWDYPREV